MQRVFSGSLIFFVESRTYCMNNKPVIARLVSTIQWSGSRGYCRYMKLQRINEAKKAHKYIVGNAIEVCISLELSYSTSTYLAGSRCPLVIRTSPVLHGSRPATSVLNAGPARAIISPETPEASVMDSFVVFTMTSASRDQMFPFLQHVFK
jgi:hypothetical protein